MKKFLALTLILILVFTFVGCNENYTSSDIDTSTIQSDNDSTSNITSTESIESNTTVESSSKNETVSKPTESAPKHTHSYSVATCTEPQKCSCGVTKGRPLGHNYKNATCTEPQRCKRCSSTNGKALGHNFTNGQCKMCNTVDAGYVQYTVIYNANGGWGETTNSNHIYNEPRALSKNGFRKAGYTFAGWSTNQHATSAQYTNTQTVKNLTKTNGDTIILYAIWEKSQMSTFDELQPVEGARNNIKFNQTATDNTGKTHNNVAVLKYGEYNQNPSQSERFTSGQFSKITGTIIPISGDLLTEGSKTIIYMYADGKKIYESSEMNKYSSPEKFEVNISGVNSIRIGIADHNSTMSWSRYGELMIENLVLVR